MGGVSLELSNDRLRKMNSKYNLFNITYSKWFYRLYLEFDDVSFLNKSDRFKNCLQFWDFDYYPENNVLDSQYFKRCFDNRFCPNCKLVDISRFISNFKKILPSLTQDNYCYMLTLTIPSCLGEDLSNTISYMSKCFSKLTRFFSSKRAAYHFVDFVGGVKVLELTHNKTDDSFHPHYHCFLMLPKCQVDSLPGIFDKTIKGRYNIKKNKFDFYSPFDCFLIKIWSLIYYKKRLNKFNLEFYDFSPDDLRFDDAGNFYLQADIRPLDQKGFYEIFKYTFKDADIDSYDTFKHFFYGLFRKRLRQGFGLLYNFQCEDFVDPPPDVLELEKEESPSVIYVDSLEDLYTTYSSCIKLSRRIDDLIE